MQIFRDGTLGQARRRTDHDHLAGIAGAGDRTELMPVQQQSTARRDGKSSEDSEQGRPAVAVFGQQRHVLPGGHRERHLVEQHDPVVFERKLLGLDRALEHEVLVAGRFRVERRAQAGRIELGAQLRVFDLRVLLDLVEVEQLLPGRRQVLVGGEHADQRAERQAAAQYQITADRQEEERRELRDEVVQEFDEELLAIDVVADPEDPIEVLAEGGELRLVGVIGVHILDDAGHFADALRQAAHLAHPGEAEQIDLALQLGNEIRLKRVERDRRQAHDQILGEDEAERGQQQPGLEQRRDHGIAEIAAERFDLAGDHGDQLALGEPAELRQRKTQDPAEQLGAQPAQHGLAEAALCTR